MIVETSALVAIIEREPECGHFRRVIAAESDRRLSAAGYLEAGIVVDSRNDPVLSRELDELIFNLGITIEPVTASQALIARQAYRDFGRGSGHPAHLNFGDCLSYALAKEKREPLLFKGDDFVHTDVEAAI